MKQEVEEVQLHNAIQLPSSSHMDVTTYIACQWILYQI